MMLSPMGRPDTTKTLIENSPHAAAFQTALAPSAAPVKPVAPGATGSPSTTGPGGLDGAPAIPPDGPSEALHGSVHARLFGGLGAQILDNVTGGFYNFAENDALLAFSSQNRDLIHALKAEFNDDQLWQISGAVAQVIENAARYDGLSGIFGFHLLPPATQDELLADMQEAMEDEAAQIRDEMRGGSSETPQPARPQPQRRDPGEFVVPEEVPQRPGEPAGPEFPNPLEPLTFNDFTDTQTPSTPAPLDPETLAGMRRNAELALELEATQGALQEEIAAMRAAQGDLIAVGRGEFELERIVRSLSNSFIAGPIQDPDTLNALAQRVLERAGELEADGYPHYALALIEAFQRDYPQFKAANGDEPSRVEQLGPEGSEFTTGENEAERVAVQARRMRENGDPEGALALIAGYLRSHGAPMEGATGGANIERSASTAIMNELRNMPVFDAARLVHELGDALDKVRPEYRAILEDILKNGHEDVLTNEDIEEVPNFVRSALQKLYDAKRSEEFRAEGAPPEFSASEITRNLQDTIDLLVVYEESSEMFDGSMVDMSGIPASIARLEVAIRAVNDPAYSAEVIEGIAALLPEIGEYSRNLLADLFTALRDTLRVPPGEDTPRFEDARNLIEPFVPGRDGAGEG